MVEWDDEMFICLFMRLNRVKVVNEKYVDFVVRELFLILVQELGEDDVYCRVGIVIIDLVDGWFGEVKMERIWLVQQIKDIGKKVQDDDICIEV